MATDLAVTGLTAGGVAVGGRPGPRPAEPTVPEPWRVLRRRRELSDTVTLELAPVDGRPVSFAPGQFHMLSVFGVGEVPISVSGDPDRSSGISYTVRAMGAVTRALCAARAGDVVGVRGPYGNDWGLPDCEGADLVLVAGGIGMAPLRPAVLAVLAQRRRFGRLRLVVGARSPETVLFPRQLAAWDNKPRCEVQVTVDYAGPDWRGRVGLVTGLLGRVAFDPASTVALICGPEVMMRLVGRALVDRGLPPAATRVSLERNMRCAVASCGHCQFGPVFVCRDGPVFTYERVAPLLETRER